MQAIDQKNLLQLAETSYYPSVSLSFPTDPLNSDPKVNSLALKNAASEALSQLEEDHKRSETYETLSQVCEDLQKDPLFWKEQGKGFAVYVSGKQSQWHSLPVAAPEITLVADHHYVVPLVKAKDFNYDFFLLELDKENTSMWWGNAEEIKLITVPDLPQSITEVTGDEVNERNLQFHTGTDAPRGDGRPASFYGSSSWKDDKDRYLERFLKAVDKAVCDFLEQEAPPLIVSGAEELVVMFRKITQVTHVVNAELKKIADSPHKEKKLHEQASKLVIAEAEKSKSIAAKQFEETKPLLKLTDLSEILKQAFEGKVQHLFITENEFVWGSFDSSSLMVTIENTRKKQSVDLLNLAAIITLRTSGRVIVLPKTKMPDLAKAAAILRY